MADTQDNAGVSIPQVKVCSKCSVELAITAFSLAHKSTTRWHAACRACERKAYNTPDRKAAALRKSGKVTSDYKPLVVTREVAALRRIGDAQRKLLELRRSADAREVVSHATAVLTERESVGSSEWLRSASPSQIATFRSAEASLNSPRSGDTGLIRLTGKYAVGNHAFAVVDIEDMEYLSRWSWKAKWNGSGSGVYAVRNSGNKTIRMHREVLGIGAFDGLEVDHKDWNTLNNQRDNLRIFTRMQNARHLRRRCGKMDALAA